MNLSSHRLGYRVKNTWHQSDRNRPSEKTLEDNAGAIAYIIWRSSLEGAKKIHGEGFEYLSDQERVGVINEFVAFLVQSTDRLVFERLEDEDRGIFINFVGKRLADQIQDNLVDIAGPGNYRRPFIAMLNERLADYATLSFQDGQPGYDFMRYFGDRVLKTMPTNQTNRWVIDQVMDLSGPFVFKKLKESLHNLFGEGGD
uniref:Uncharacterized protein n=1 Tax=Candidatus Kentrum sp. MB TaxID=2138164 RepID=A0A450X474_9GAMM|nr:MAG: hypothetical protein BECKMB1821G_GA0114241_100718 [Candidatus Kentron sp. MB]VFK34099.1 MAG: hypothetical protein BECKMB1821I_GA0114274_10613 [Candidatus Kentron sp. MB]VFK76738.1 MAG: hypothetical protein BECKMB1821H_GA0114242_10723 [Candidatus Kentron sp. MB]